MRPPAALLLLLLSLLGAAQGVKKLRFAFTTRENAPIGTQVGDLKKPQGAEPQGRVLAAELEDATVYESPAPCKKLFSVDTKNAFVQVASLVDREAVCPGIVAESAILADCKCRLRVFATNGDLIEIIITITDENDHQPSFPNPIKFITISESAPVGYEHSLDPATDPDLPPYNIRRYVLTPAGPSGEMSAFEVRFEASSSELKLRLRTPLDYESVRQYNATLLACDAGQQPKCGSQLLVINVRDENDNGPQFASPRIDVPVLENASVGHIVVRANATDADSGDNGRLMYRKKNNRDPGTANFAVNEETGDVYVQRQLVFSKDRRDPISLVIEVSDQGSPVRKAVTTVFVAIKDVNNFSPTIQVRPKGGKNRVELLENSPRETVIGHLFVSDADDPKTPGGRFKCSLANPPGLPTQFRLPVVSKEEVSSIYSLVTATVFNREHEDHVVARVVCTDEGGLSTDRDITVYILDENEFRPSFDGTPYFIKVPENSPADRMVFQVRASDEDRTAHLLYSLDKDSWEYFRIVPETGEIFTRKQFDRETTPTLHFGVQVTDSVDPSARFIGRANVTVEVSDVNDNPPTLPSMLSFTVDENTPEAYGQGSVSVGRLVAIDPDIGRNGEMTFRLLGVKVGSLKHGGVVENPRAPPPPNGTFLLRSDGALFLMRPLDREQHELLHLEIQVSDRGSPPLRTNATVIITVRDSNDNAPSWKHPTTQENAKNISSLAKPGYVVTRVHAADPDYNSQVRYELVKGQRYFKVDPVSGEVRISTVLSPGVYRLKFRASDGGNPVRSSEIEYLVRVYYQDPYASSVSKSKMNFPLIIAMIVVTCIICVSLIIAIVVVRRMGGGLRASSCAASVVSTQKWVQDGATLDNMYSPGQWMRPEMYPGQHSPPGAYCQGNNVDKYHATNVTQTGGHQATLMRMHGYPVDMEVASADSGHGASEEEGLQAGDPRAKEMRVCSQRTPCPILPEDAVVQCGCSNTAAPTTATVTTTAPTQSAGGIVFDYSRTLDHHLVGRQPLTMALNNAMPTATPMTSFSTFPTMPRHSASSNGAPAERRSSQSNV